jgi:D-alanyl-D-alanine-carboxypeptidase/D-alanyl-D-alanine-endopeptidase
MRIRLIILLLVVAAPLIAAETPSDADVRKTLIDRIDVQKQGVGIVVGLIDASGRRIVAYGQTAIGSGQPVTADTIFEIGSMTKVFTALVLADMAQKGEVALTDPVAKLLPSSVKMPARGGKVITLEDLATHTSGLPRLPSNIAPKDPNNPYADYTPAELYAFLSGYELTRDIGSHYEYSNLGGGLLGHVLAIRSGMPYETLVRSRILDPLGMKSTSVRLSEAATERLAKGFDANLRPAENWEFSALAGAGALRSTANDLLTFLSAAIGLTKTPLSKAMAAMTSVRRKTDSSNVEVALGWHISKIDSREIVWHNGGTGGYRSYMGYDPRRRFGVVVLSNASTPAGVDDIGLHLLVPSKQRQEMKLDEAVLERYVGSYQLAPQFVLTVTREGNRLFVQATGQPRFEVFAYGERDFFYKVVDAQLTFDAGTDGQATRVILHQNGHDVPGQRLR